MTSCGIDDERPKKGATETVDIQWHRRGQLSLGHSSSQVIRSWCPKSRQIGPEFNHLA